MTTKREMKKEIIYDIREQAEAEKSGTIGETFLPKKSAEELEEELEASFNPPLKI